MFLPSAARVLSIACALFVVLGCGASASAEEERVCGIFGLEASMFEAWREVANRGPSAQDVNGYAYESIVVESSDRTSLSGYRISKENGAAPNRALLFLQGNAMRADQLRDILVYFAARGFDVFVFDYRGYGKSQGVPLLKPISDDQRAIADFLRARGYDQLFLYGISIGGVFALGPQMPIDAFEALAVDSTPAQLPWYALCPSEFDPIANVPGDASNILVLSGGRDAVIRASDVAPLGKEVETRGGKYRHEPSLGHPLMDNPESTQSRFETVADFFDAR